MEENNPASVNSDEYIIILLGQKKMARLLQAVIQITVTQITVLLQWHVVLHVN